MAGAQDWFSAAELAALGLPGLPTTKRGMQLQIDREGWEARTCDLRGALARKRKARGGGVEYHVSLLPEAARAKLMFAAHGRAQAERPDREGAWLRWERLPAGMKAQAYHRLDVIGQVEALVRHGMRKTAAVDEVVRQTVREARLRGEHESLCSSTVHGWFALIAGVPPEDRCAYLAPAYQGRTAKAACADEGWELYKGLYLTQSKPTHAACFRRLERKAAEMGWAVPSAKTLQRRMDAEVPPAAQTLFRYGPEALNHAFPHLQRDRGSIAPMQILNLDGHTWDVRVAWPDGTISRPLSLAVQDIASGKILAIRHDMTLNHHLVRLALGDTFRDFGLCETLLMDNGRENAAAAISGGQHRLRWGKTPEEEPAGLLKTLGIKALFATPYWGQAKPIERAFRNFAHDIAKGPEFVGAYTGHNTTSKPENYGSRAVPYAEFAHVVARELAFYNDQAGRRGAGMNGRSFNQVFEAGMAGRAPRMLTPEQLRLCMLASKPVSMDPKSGAVTVEGHRYWSPALADLKRQRVTVRFDPEQMALPAYVYSLDGRLLAQADRMGAGSFDNLSDGRGQRKAVRDYVRAEKLRANALRRLEPRDVAAQLASIGEPEAAPEAPKVVRPNFTAPRKAEQLGQPAGASSDFDANWERGLDRVLGRG
ncbi:transposase domain-containing protein [Phenylobacterium ferrooxidans]|uniref:Mu transposase C-terminal domain-containing protein n=1 Tax=Phenylobacterium ferrooxidans TaxID=2982689 RepID=A0ABW6CKR5_9CAUL